MNFFRQRKTFDEPSVVAVRKQCRICLLSKDQSPSPVLGFERLKGSEQTWSYQLREKLKDVKAMVEELFGSEHQETELDRRLIAPCKCSGTMKYVHRGCLNVWRLNSTRSDSYFKCEQCFAPYKFSETKFSRILSNSLLLKLVSMGTFVLWMYGWFFFVYVTESFSGLLAEPVHFVDYGQMQTGHIYHPPHYHFTEMPNSKTTASTTEAPPEPTIVTDWINDTTNEQNNTNEQPFSEWFLAWLDYHAVHIIYTCILVSLFDFLIVDPTVILSVNTIYFIWRSLKYGTIPDQCVLTGFILFGMVRSLRSIHFTVRLLIERYVKLRCIEIEDLDYKKEPGLMRPVGREHKAQTHLIN